MKPMDQDDRRVMTDPTTWVDEYGDFLFRYALSRVRDPRLAEDLVQETFLAALKSKENFAGKASVRTWLVTILKHKMVDHFRKTFRERQLEPEAEEWGDPNAQSFDTSTGHWRNGPHEWNVDPDTVLERKEFWRALAGCLDRMPRRLAVVFVLRELEGMNTEEICKEFEITPTNLWVMLHRARNRLRSCLEASLLQTRQTEGLKK